MKKFLSILLALTLLLCCGFGSIHAANIETEKVPTARFASNCSEEISALAAQYLANMKVQAGSLCVALGYTQEEFYGMSAGTPFTVYGFDETGKVCSDDYYMCPLIYNGEIIGLISMVYDETVQEYTYKLSKNHAAELNALLDSDTLNAASGLVIGSMGDKLFATDGTDVSILFDAPDEGVTISADAIRNVCNTAKISSGKNYAQVMKVTEFTTPITALNQERSGTLPNALDVVPVLQDNGICGVASWATVLNYRFRTSYTEASLRQAMLELGTWNDPLYSSPTMTNYRDYANRVHDAGCVFINATPSISVVSSAIGSYKPVMGCWDATSPTRGDLEHSVLIVGYTRNSPNPGYTYCVLNPWYDYTELTSFLDPNNVTYTTKSGETLIWHLTSAVY